MTRPLFRRFLSIEGPFRLPHQNERRASTTLPRTSPKTDAGKHQRLHSYSSAAPRAELLNHLVIHQAPRNHPGCSAPSRIRNSLRLKSQRSIERRLQLVTSLGGATRQVILVCLSPQAGIVSAHPNRSYERGGEVRFRQVEERSTCLPIVE